jgi:hypothetical protein
MSSTQAAAKAAKFAAKAAKLGGKGLLKKAAAGRHSVLQLHMRFRLHSTIPTNAIVRPGPGPAYIKPKTLVCTSTDMLHAAS